MNNKGFSFVEMLVVVTIIALLTGGAAVTYSATTSRSRDARRRSDIQSMRSAMELCRSQDGQYPVLSPNNINSCLTSGTITCFGGAVYLNPVPQDPQNPSPCYRYAGSSTTYTFRATINGSNVDFTQP